MQFSTTRAGIAHLYGLGVAIISRFYSWSSGEAPWVSNLLLMQLWKNDINRRQQGAQRLQKKYQTITCRIRNYFRPVSQIHQKHDHF
jgi:hypothetical protein